MDLTCTYLAHHTADQYVSEETTRSIVILKIDGYHPNKATIDPDNYVKSRWTSTGMSWRSVSILVCLAAFAMALKPTAKPVRSNKLISAQLSGRLVDPSRVLQPSA
jgi:hypothetical protein